jgi:hypothetical protein
MEIQRIISIYEKSGDDFIEEISISNDLDLLKSFLSPKKEDPDMFDPYEIDEVFYNRLSETYTKLREYPYSEYAFFVEAYDE